MIMCWANYPNHGIKEKLEPLGIHLINVAEGMLKHPDFKRISKKLSKAYGIDTKVSQDIIFLIGLLHDIGKAHTKYQRELEKGFSKHEFYSAFAVNYVLTTRNVDETIKTLITYPIMLHHYAQRYDANKAYGGVSNELGIKESPVLPIHEQCIKDVIKALTYGESTVVSDLGKDIINELIKEVKTSNVLYLYPLGNDPLKPLQSIIQQNRWFGITALTGILNEVDGKTARRNRRDKI